VFVRQDGNTGALAIDRPPIRMRTFGSPHVTEHVPAPYYLL